MRRFYPQRYTALWTRGHVRSCDELKTLSPLSQCLWPTNLAMLLHSVRSLPPDLHKVIWLNKYAISSLPQWLSLPYLAGWFYTLRVSFDKVAESLDFAVLHGHEKNQMRLISTITRPLSMKLSKVVSYYMDFPPIKSGNLSNTSSFEIARQIENISFTLLQWLKSPKLAAW